MQDTESKLATLAAQQYSNNGLEQHCPRCGGLKIKPEILDNPMSKYANIRICADCHRAEQFGSKDKHLDFDRWAFARPDFNLIPTENKAQTMPAGQTCWAWAYDWPKGASMPSLKQAPIQGVLTKNRSEIGDANDKAEWFVPYVKNTKRPAWTKAFRVECLNIDTDKDAAIEAYNNAVIEIAVRYEGMAGMIRRDTVIIEPGVQATAAIAGMALTSGHYGWACVIITNNATAVLSGNGREQGIDDYKAAEIALDTAIKQNKILGFTNLTVWTKDADITMRIFKLQRVRHEVVLKNPEPGESEVDKKMHKFLSQAIDTALQQASHASETI